MQTCYTNQPEVGYFHFFEKNPKKTKPTKNIIIIIVLIIDNIQIKSNFIEHFQQTAKQSAVKFK